ncbi:hypothetical protein BAU15_09430 [Enterococcus sp. JM4C]|uniref:hypothetical protein n=1 Tax=Candidatus Enterococcus huntleyi TaxID=1857217 RepID=UPI00137AC656|nr:hypothetical protein [Enterococcus sp. JM4C]KAF1298062.1 hypothetical protein BAU15_09430 [Enterococcus sp. JM4C]
MEKSRKVIASVLILLFWLLVIGSVLGLVVLNNVNLAENWLGINEYELAETRNRMIRLIPVVWLVGTGLMMIIFLVTGLKKRKKLTYWLVTLLVIPVGSLIIGCFTTYLPFDRNDFRDEAKTAAIMGKLSDLKLLKGKDLQLISFSFHVRNVPLKSGVYAVARVVNPTTDLQDEYWYWPTNPLMKWKKDADEITIPVSQTIAYDKIDWTVIPKIIKETEASINELDTYYPGVSIVILNGSSKRWTWTVGVQGIRGHTDLNFEYDLAGEYISQWR